jgi:hypothetical protein
VALNNDTPWPSVADAKLRVLNIQRKLHQWSFHDHGCLWKAGCAATCTSGLAGESGETEPE